MPRPHKARRYFKRYKMLIFAAVVTIAVLSGFLVASVNQPTIRVNAQSSAPSTGPTAPVWKKSP